MCGLQLSLVQNSYCNHDIKIDTKFCKHFERGKHANDFYDNFDDPLYVPKFSSCVLQIVSVQSTSSACNYSEDEGEGGREKFDFVVVGFMLSVAHYLS